MLQAKNTVVMEWNDTCSRTDANNSPYCFKGSYLIIKDHMSTSCRVRLLPTPQTHWEGLNLQNKNSKIAVFIKCLTWWQQFPFFEVGATLVKMVLFEPQENQ